MRGAAYKVAVIRRGSEGSREDPAVEVHADRIVVLDVLVEKHLH